MPISEFSAVRSAARAIVRLKYEAQSLLSGEASPDVVANITTFSDEAAGFESGYIQARDDTYYVADSEEFDISRFFARPIRLAAITWTVGTGFAGLSIPVFQTFWQNKRNANKLANYRNMKCDMCVKILVNGSPFHYGMLLASVLPETAGDNFVNVGLTEVDCIRASQNPHIYIDPTSSTGGCLRLPFSDHYNAYDITSANALATAGTLQIRQLVQLAHVSGVVEPITVTVMAWAENVVLGAPTNNNPSGLVAQSGDEYGTGVVSRPAFVLASVAGKLRKVPYLAPYAMATQLGASTIATVAQIFGYTKPTVVTDIAYMKQREQPNFASATQHDPIYKATLDDKQEVSIDPRVVGLTGEDQMSIVDIAMRESYITQFTWQQTGVPETRLFSTLVTPNMYRTAGTLVTQYYQTPACWVTAPFQFWRGTLRFRFTAVASAFHRGRIRIVYEPAAGASASTEYNTNLTYVWDLSESKEAIIDVGWHHHWPYLLTSTLVDGIVPFTTAATALNNPQNNFCNGTLSLFIMNELTAPDTNLVSPVTIMMSTSACEDFEVFSPSDTISPLTYFPQSGSKDDTNFVPHRRPAHVTFGNTISRSNYSAAIHHGDPVVSLRTLLKRYTYSATWGTVGALANTRYAWTLVLPSFPLYGGRAPAGVHNATTPTNFTAVTLLNYFTPAFYARRGGIRHRFIPNAAEVPVSNAVISRTTTPQYANVLAVMDPYTTTSSIARGNRVTYFGARNGISGLSTSSGSAGGSLDMEIPFHTNRRFHRGRSGISNGTSGNGVALLVKFFQAVAGSPAVTYDHYVSAADDFSLSGFVDVPIMYNSTSIPAAT